MINHCRNLNWKINIKYFKIDSINQLLKSFLLLRSFFTLLLYTFKFIMPYRISFFAASLIFLLILLNSPSEIVVLDRSSYLATYVQVLPLKLLSEFPPHPPQRSFQIASGSWLLVVSDGLLLSLQGRRWSKKESLAKNNLLS